MTAFRLNPEIIANIRRTQEVHDLFPVEVLADDLSDEIRMVSPEHVGRLLAGEPMDDDLAEHLLDHCNVFAPFIDPHEPFFVKATE